MASSNSWDSYIWQIQNKWSAKQAKYLITNCCVHAAIYGLDGSPWATSAEWPGLLEYQHDLEQDDGSTSKIAVNEFQCVVQVATGKRMPTAAGVRMGNTKFVYIRHDPDDNSVFLSKSGGGGACIAKTRNAYVIGIWDKNAIMSNNTPQSTGYCNDLTLNVASKLKKAGY